MLLDSSPKLDELIVELLADKPSLQAANIQDQLLTDGKEFTIQAIYKALRLLENGGVVVKHKKKYALRLSWVTDIENLAKDASANYTKRAVISLPKKQQKVIWHYNSLLTLNNFWSQILLLLINKSETHTLLTWMPHSGAVAQLSKILNF